jgi:hypothetical protein
MDATRGNATDTGRAQPLSSASPGFVTAAAIRGRSALLSLANCYSP